MSGSPDNLLLGAGEQPSRTELASCALRAIGRVLGRGMRPKEKLPDQRRATMKLW